MNPRVVHFYFPIFGTLFIPIDTRFLPLHFRPSMIPFSASNNGLGIIPDFLY